MHEPVLRARGLRKVFPPSTTVLDGVDVDVAPGEWLAVMGPSGCGKSTLLNLLGGLDVPTAGTVEIEGRHVETASESARARVRRGRVGIVFQAYNLVPHLSALDNVALPMRLTGASVRIARHRARELLARVGVADLVDLAPGALSGGQAQRVAFARALANDARLLLADEPTGALDSDSTRTLMRVLRQLHEDGVAIVMVTHEHRVASAADRVLFMLDGKIIDERRLTGLDQDPSRTTFANLVELETW